MEFFDQLQHQTNTEREYLLAAPIIHRRSPAPPAARSTSPSSLRPTTTSNTRCRC